MTRSETIRCLFHEYELQAKRPDCPAWAVEVRTLLAIPGLWPRLLDLAIRGEYDRMKIEIAAATTTTNVTP